MFDKLGVDWAGSLLAFLGVAFMPIPFLFYIYGERLRKLSSYAPTDFPRATDEENQPESLPDSETATETDSRSEIAAENADSQEMTKEREG